MARAAKIQCELKRMKKVAKDAKKRAKIKMQEKQIYAQKLLPGADFDDLNSQLEQLQIKKQKLSRNSSRVRLRQRCQLTGRSRGVYRKFKLCKSKLRELAMKGWLPGVRKSSW